MEVINDIAVHQENKYVKNVYTEIANYFDNTRAYSWDWVRNFVSIYVDPKNVVYDIGCGNGRNMMLTNEAHFIGVDNCPKFVEICKKKNLDVVIGDMCELPFDNQSADALMCVASFHHLMTYQRRKMALLEMVRVCKDKAYIMISVWSIKQPIKTRRKFDTYGDTIVKWNQNGVIYDRYYYIFRIEEITKLFDHCGLFIVKHTYDCGNEVFILRKK